MSIGREKISTGPNERPINESIAQSGPGIPDEALAPGERLLEEPTEEEARKPAHKLGRDLEIETGPELAPEPRNKVGKSAHERDTLPLDGE